MSYKKCIEIINEYKAEALRTKESCEKAGHGSSVIMLHYFIDKCILIEERFKKQMPKEVVKPKEKDALELFTDDLDGKDDLASPILNQACGGMI